MTYESGGKYWRDHIPLLALMITYVVSTNKQTCMFVLGIKTISFIAVVLHFLQEQQTSWKH